MNCCSIILISGPNVNPDNLNGGMTDVVSGLVGHLAHRYLNVDPTTGRIIGAIAGNLIFNLGEST